MAIKLPSLATNSASFHLVWLDQLVKSELRSSFLREGNEASRYYWPSGTPNYSPGTTYNYSPWSVFGYNRIPAPVHTKVKWKINEMATFSTAEIKQIGRQIYITFVLFSFSNPFLLRLLGPGRIFGWLCRRFNNQLILTHKRCKSTKWGKVDNNGRKGTNTSEKKSTKHRCECGGNTMGKWQVLAWHDANDDSSLTFTGFFNFDFYDRSGNGQNHEFGGTGWDHSRTRWNGQKKKKQKERKMEGKKWWQ